MARHPQQNTALIIDDEPGICSVLKNFLHAFGLGAVASTTAEEGLRLLDGAHADYGIVILDYRLLDMDGVNCFREVRKRRANMPVLFISAYASQPGLTELLEQPGTGLLNKPFDVAQFRKAVEHLAPGLFVKSKA